MCRRQPLFPEWQGIITGTVHVLASLIAIICVDLVEIHWAMQFETICTEQKWVVRFVNSRTFDEIPDLVGWDWGCNITEIYAAFN